MLNFFLTKNIFIIIITFNYQFFLLLNTMNMREKLKNLIDEVCRANIDIKKNGLVTLTWGNASAIDRKTGIVAIKPSGVDYAVLTPEKIVLTDISGQVIESDLKPSSDLATHLELYRAFDDIGAVIHTHSCYATSYAQAGRALACSGTTHADYFHGTIPVTDEMTSQEIAGEYEANTGKVIVRKIRQLYSSALECPAIFVIGHGPFCWGETIHKAVETAIVLETVCKINLSQLVLNKNNKNISKALMDKHYYRKHGSSAYYGQL
jgi:L-ribulose-5-phosphate 4-epimerase